jgi:hypothetical protein
MHITIIVNKNLLKKEGKKKMKEKRKKGKHNSTDRDYCSSSRI